MTQGVIARRCCRAERAGPARAQRAPRPRRLGGVDLYELAERYGTTVRTIRRDPETLQEVCLPLS